MKKIHRYTLVELLVVVAIAAVVILGIATPAFTAMMKGGAMTSTTRELAAKIKAARSYAVTNNCYVALVFPTGKDESKIGENNFISDATVHVSSIKMDEGEGLIPDRWWEKLEK
ncbi:MAG: hypothetical protein V8T87_11100 [Victivallales bacterium]